MTHRDSRILFGPEHTLSGGTVAYDEVPGCCLYWVLACLICVISLEQLSIKNVFPMFLAVLGRARKPKTWFVGQGMVDRYSKSLTATTSSCGSKINASRMDAVAQGCQVDTTLPSLRPM